MVSSAGSGPNYYQTLGLTPAASEDEIKQAFTSKMGLFGAHPLGEAAQLCIAYETLRNPAKRRDYDRSLGLTPVPEGSQWGFGMAQKKWRPFIAAGPLDSAAEEAAPAAPNEPHVAAQPEVEAPEPRIASFIAASLRDLARPIEEAPASVGQPGQERRAEPLPKPRLEPRIEEILAARPVEVDSFGYAEEERTFDLKRPAIAVGGFVIAAGLVGAVSGLSLKGDVESATGAAPPAVTLAVPAAKQQASSTASTAAVSTVDAGVTQPVRAYDHGPRPKHGASRQRLTSWAQQQVPQGDAQSAVVEPQPAEIASNDPAADPLAPKPLDASMPLPNRVIARTIERIGYSCGDVSSTSAVEGSSGAYNVTCSSGQTYQATPVHGRYHFRRSGSR
ncbi:MAG: hypothetical protein ACJ8F4_00965 [Sphingomonas sp.]